MAADFDRESMMEMFIYEMTTLLEQLENIIIQGDEGFTPEQINEIFRIMHTIKGSAAMMLFDSISNMSHKMEDIFFYLREENPKELDNSTLADLILEGMDFIKTELNKIENGEPADGNPEHLIKPILDFLENLKNGNKPATDKKNQTALKPKEKGNYNYHAKIFFDDDSELVNVRAFTLVHYLQDYAIDISHVPTDLVDPSASVVLQSTGLTVEFSSELDYKKINELLSNTIYLKSLELVEKGDEPISSTENKFYAILTYDDGCQMENVRAFALVNEAEKIFEKIYYEPSDLESIESIEIIRNVGFKIHIETTKSYDEVHKFLKNVIYLKDLLLEDKTGAATGDEPMIVANEPLDVINKQVQTSKQVPEQKKAQHTQQIQKVISVNIGKLDTLLNLMGELVIAEAMVTQNPDLKDLELESFYKETRQLRKIITDVQDTVMSMRMVPLSPTFFKMHRIVRDMCKSLDKVIELEIVGEDTEVDKNIIEHISDPLMHIIRNSIDHGIEIPEIREQLGKDREGTVLLQAKNSGGDVIILIKDDGAGLNRNKILEKARNNGLLEKREEDYSDKEIYQFIFLPGFSTNDVVTGYSGRGVGMDVVTTNIEAVGGSISVDSIAGEGSVFTLKIPLTLAIIDGMTVKLDGAKYTIPIISIKQSFNPISKDIFTDPSGNEIITVRGECYNIVRLSNFFQVSSSITNIEDGIMIMIENGEQTICLLVDELLGEQQVVVKTIPKYIKKVQGISGCTLLGNGDISLIIDVAGFFDK